MLLLYLGNHELIIYCDMDHQSIGNLSLLGLAESSLIITMTWWARCVVT